MAKTIRKNVLLALAYYEHRMHLGASHFAREANWILDTRMAHYGTVPPDWRGDGILTYALPDREDLTRYLRKSRVPIVTLSADLQSIATASVVLDNFAIGRIAGEHLIERGLTNLAFFKCTDYADIREREAGFAAAVDDADLEYSRIDWHAVSSEKPRAKMLPWLVRQLKKLPGPLGVMAQSDHRAYTLENACEEAELSVPVDVAIVGVDNDEYTCDFARTPITSVDSNRQELAYRGASLLNQLMQGNEPPEGPIVVPPAGLVVRQSSDVLAIENANVAKALAFIWQNFRQPIGVEDIVAATNESRCGLYDVFQKHVGRTMRQELERKRIEYAQQLLLSTSDKVSQVAHQCGFGSGEQFCRVFAKVIGCTPSKYRQLKGNENC